MYGMGEISLFPIIDQQKYSVNDRCNVIQVLCWIFQDGAMYRLFHYIAVNILLVLPIPSKCYVKVK